MMDIETASERIKWVSEYLDREIPKKSRGKVDGGIGLDALRLIKLMEECGEVVTNFIKYRNLNPRKAIANPMETGTEDDMVKELFDVAFTAIGAAEHLLGNSGAALGRFLEHAANVKTRLKGVPEPHYYEPQVHNGSLYRNSPCAATSPLWDGVCSAAASGGFAVPGQPVAVHLDPKPWFVEEAVGYGEKGGFDGRYSWAEWFNDDTGSIENLAVWKPRLNYVQEKEAYRGGR